MSFPSYEHPYRTTANHDEIWSHSPHYVNRVVSEIITDLRPSQTDHIVDLAAGTGVYAQKLSERCSPVNPITCVEPFAPAIQRLATDSRFKVVRNDAETFLASNSTYDAILVKEVVHHFSHLDEIFLRMSTQLNVGGRCLIVMWPPRLPYPLFSAAAALFEQSQPHFLNVAAL